MAAPMEQGVQSGVASTAVDFPPKKLARQLDFTAYSGLPGRAAVHEQQHESLPQPLQQQQQQPQQWPQLAPSLLSQQPPSLMPQAQQTLPPAAASLPRPSIAMSMKPESPKPRSRPVVDGKDGTPKKQKQCNCKNSRCLKLIYRRRRELVWAVKLVMASTCWFTIIFLWALSVLSQSMSRN